MSRRKSWYREKKLFKMANVSPRLQTARNCSIWHGISRRSHGCVTILRSYRCIAHVTLSAAGASVTSMDWTKYKAEACFESTRAIIVKRTDRSVDGRVDFRERMPFMLNSWARFYFLCVSVPPTEITQSWKVKSQRRKNYSHYSDRTCHGFTGVY